MFLKTKYDHINSGFLDLASRMEFSKLFSKLQIKNTWNFLFHKKIPLSCFYSQLEFDNYEHNCQP